MMVGGINLAIGVTLIFLNSLALSDKSEEPPKSIIRRVVRFLFGLIFNAWVILPIAIWIWWQLLGIYTMKNPSYNYGAIRDHELFDSKEFYHDSVKWFKRTLIGKTAFRFYRRGSRLFWRNFRKSIEPQLNTAWATASVALAAQWKSVKPWTMEKLSAAQEYIDANILGLKDEL